MGADGVFQLKEPLFLPDCGPAEKNLGLDAHILHLLDADDLVNVDAQQLVLLVLHPQPQRTDIAAGRADRDHIYGTLVAFHAGSLPFCSFVLL